nr:hypothetical protein [Tanacetum cinerariifolium]
MLIFKVDFEKAFDSGGRKYLDYMLHNLGFGLTWRSWIKACLESSRTSILVNGSPTSEFFVKRGLRQRDILSPFLFIIVMEGLHMALSEASHSGLINGIKIGSSDITLSHTFYADDVVITTDWSLLIWILLSVHSMANTTRCSLGSFPLIYLGLPTGANMNLMEGSFGLYENSSNGRMWYLDTLLERSLDRGCHCSYLNDIIKEISLTKFSSERDVCYWTIANNDMFSVSSTRQHIDSYFMSALDILTQSNKAIPRKVNIFIWHFMLDRLPHRLNLSREIDIPTIGFSSCNGNVESSNHIFFGCGITNDIWSNVRNWCDITFPSCSSFDHWKKLRLEEIDDVESNALAGKPFKMPGLKVNKLPQLLLEGPSLNDDVEVPSFNAKKEKETTDYAVSESNEEDANEDENSIDEDNVINEVDVDMQELYQNIDKDVEWVGPSNGNLEVPAQMDVEEGYNLDDYDMYINCDSDVESSKERKKRMRALRKESKNKVGHFYVGQEFADKKETTTLVTCQAVATRRKLYVWKNDKNNTWTVKTYKDEHTCLQTREVKLLTDKWLSNEIEDIVKPNLSIPVKALKEKLQKNYQVGISKGKVKKGKGCINHERDDLNLNPMSNSTFISDRQKGILPAIAQVFLCSKHRLCVRHIYENFKAQWKGNQFKELVWRCVAATTVPYFDRQMEKLKSLDEDAYEYLKKIPLQHW